MEDSALEALAVSNAIATLCEVRVFGNGLELIERLADPIEPPDLLLLDWVVPGMAGIDVCRFIRQTHDELALPILMLTGSAGEDNLVEALASGANDFIVKPFGPAELVARVQRALRVKGLNDEKRARHHVRMEELQQETQLRRLHLEEELGAAADENRRRDKYLGILGHDLRTPLSAIVLAAGRLRRGDDLGTVRLGERIERSADRMALLIRDILDFARGRLANGIPISPRPADVGEICHDVIEELRTAHPGREIRFESAGQAQGSWDSERLSQAVSNLVGNAIEHSTTPVSVRADGTSPDVVRVAIHNGGAPIPAEDLPVIFEPFRKRDASSGGLGLGLYIVKQVLLAHGGSVDVTSSREDGTVFLLTMPRGEPTEGRGPPHHEPARHQRRTHRALGDA